MKITELNPLGAYSIPTLLIPAAAFNQEDYVNVKVTPYQLWEQYIKPQVESLIAANKSTYNFGTIINGGSGEGSGEGSGGGSADLTNYSTTEQMQSYVQSYVTGAMANAPALFIKLVDVESVVVARYKYTIANGLQELSYDPSNANYLEIPINFATSSVLYKLKGGSSLSVSYTQGQYHISNLAFTLDKTGFSGGTITVKVTAIPSWTGVANELCYDNTVSVASGQETISKGLASFSSSEDTLSGGENAYIDLYIDIGNHREIVTLRHQQSVSLNFNYYITGTSIS